jgi:uncharacterized membrane protein
MLEQLRQMPNGVRFLLLYALLMLSGLALTLPLVVEQAVEAPISLLGLLWMLLIAYLIFTVTLVLQRKQSAWALSIGLASLSLPLVFVLWQWGGIIAALAGAALAAALFIGLRRPAARAWFNEP